MYKNSNTIIPYDEIDSEIRELVRCINRVDGIETTESCFGHYKRSCMIWCKAESIEAMTNFLFNYFDYEWNWKICFDLDDVNRNWTDIHFYIDSVTSEKPRVLEMTQELTDRFLCR